MSLGTTQANPGSGGTVFNLDSTSNGGVSPLTKIDVGPAGTTTLLGLGQQTMSASIPVVFASDQSALNVATHAVTQSGTWNIGTVTTVTTLTNLTNWGNILDNAAFTDGTTRLSMSGYIFDEVAGTALTENDGAAARIDSKRAQVFALEDATTRGQRQAVSASGNAAVEVKASITIPTKETRSTTPSQTSIAASATNVTLLASNASRLGATIMNDTGGASLYVKLGSVASTTSYTVLLVAGAYYEIPFGYTGQVDGIWASASGNARMTELT